MSECKKIKATKVLTDDGIGDMVIEPEVKLATTPPKSLLFSGDVLFSQAVGRTDLPLASHGVLVDSIKKIMNSMTDKESVVCPGHGVMATIGSILEKNQFVKTYTNH